MRRIRLASLLFFVNALAFAATPPELFRRAKDQFRLHAYGDCLVTLQALETESQKAENEVYRAAVLPGLAFYRGACLAGLDRSHEAQAQFEIFLAFRPDTVLDPAVYPKKVIQVLEQTRKNLGRSREVAEEGGSMAASYRAFVPPPSNRAPESLEDWAEGPVRFLMTPEQRRDYSRMSDPVSRSEFVTAFWKSHDPRPETLGNEFRELFEKRVAFADAYFTQDEVRGSLTDRGMVFILLGPPTYIGRNPIKTGDDSADPAGMSRFTRNDITTALKTAGAGTNSNLVFDYMTGPGTKILDGAANWREVWHYRRELLPKGLPYQQVDFEFITRKGYGKNVLQREDQAFNALEAARRAVQNLTVAAPAPARN